jgi:hypothetical protein
VKLIFAFAVFLDGEPVGNHRFEVEARGEERRVTSVARFDVKLLGIPVYRYRHEATEGWRGDCLLELEARTDEGGRRTEVRSKPEECVMSFAYWNPRILQQRELLNAQTGKLERVSITALGAGRYRISGTKHPIELRYSPEGEWLELDATVAGGRRLSYRLQ